MTVDAFVAGPGTRSTVTRSTVAWRPLAWLWGTRDASLAVVACAGLFVWARVVNVDALSYLGLRLLLSSAVPLVFATVSQALIIGLGDIDLGLGYFIGLANAGVAVYLTREPLVGVLCLVGMIGGYVLMALLVSLRRVPSIIVTLGAGFIWLGLGELILPSPGGSEPGWLARFFNVSTPLLPLPAWLIVAGGVATYVLLFRSRPGIALRASGSNEAAFIGAGWNAVWTRVVTYGLAAAFAILAALSVTAITASGDPTASENYTLLAIAGVIVGGGSFSGGRMSAVGMVAGALVVSLVGSVLGMVNVSSSLQEGAQGLVLIGVIAGRRLWRGARR